MEITIEKSQEQADLILSILPFIKQLDIPYLREVEARSYENANRAQSAYVLFRDISPNSIRLIKLQGQAIRILCDYHDTLKEISEVKEEIANTSNQQTELKRLFGL